MIIDKYHTAVGTDACDVCDEYLFTDTEYLFKDNVVLFKHDITSGIHHNFYKADCIMLETSWRHGYNKFRNNTIACNTTFGEYVRSVIGICKALNVPSFIVIGKSMKADFERAGFTFQDIKFKQHGNYPSVLAKYNFHDFVDVENEFELRDFVSDKYDAILDFNCGFGSILNYSLPKNKLAILSDVNDTTLLYIKGKLTNECI